MNYPLPNCSKCISDLNLEVVSSKKNSDIFIGEEKGRKIYFAPVGNQYNFGLFAQGKTPKVVIMGITTSPTARDNFLKDYNNLLKENSAEDALRKSCAWNIFNSDKPTLQNKLEKIINKTGINKMIGCSNDIKINSDFFSNENSEENTKVINNIYFTQMIMCASCNDKIENKKSKESTAPTTIKEIGSIQERCIKSQLSFIESFSNKADLLISFGTINKDIIKEHDKEEITKKKFKYHVNIHHPTTKGWNEIDKMDNDRDSFIREIERIINNNGKIRYKDRYKKESINCYDELIKIKEIIELLSK